MRLDRFYFSQDADESPLLAKATHVFLRYCDGGYFSGDRLAPVQSGVVPRRGQIVQSPSPGWPSNSGTPIYFRGRYITEAVVQDLYAKHALADATDIVLSGCSAGAIRVYSHLDAMRALKQALDPQNIFNPGKIVPAA